MKYFQEKRYFRRSFESSWRSSLERFSEVSLSLQKEQQNIAFVFVLIQENLEEDRKGFVDSLSQFASAVIVLYALDHCSLSTTIETNRVKTYSQLHMFLLESIMSFPIL